MRALATKYRPKSFEDLVGQENIVTILQNQIREGAVKQGYLLTGGAGTGQTTYARIFANSLNAEILEIDGASYNGVDSVRELQEKLQYKPLEKEYKIVIYDEVHMLSTGAFNALLKILEEPPEHVIFILATTDPQKIPSTILSRVQRFDFKRMTTQQTMERLKYILEEENVEMERATSEYPYYDVTEDAIEYIAKLAQGGMRSAISILDTCLGYNNILNLQEVINILGAADYDVFMDLTTSIITQDFGKIVEVIENEHLKGNDLKQLMKSFTEFVVDMMKVQTTDNFDLTSIPAIYHPRILKGVTYITTNKIDLKGWFRQLSAMNNNIRYENSPKTLIQGELICIS